MEKINENILNVSVAEEIRSNDVPPGMPASPSTKEEQLPKDEIEKRQKIMLEYTRLSGRYCAPHSKQSRWVTDKDLARVMADGKDLVAMCNIPRGKYSGISALSHSEIDDVDPLRFFVLPNGMVVINPIIVDHSEHPIFKDEGCMAHPESDTKKNVRRYNKVTVMYQTLAKDKNSELPVMSSVVTEKLSGGPSHVFQHECEHLNGKDVFTEGQSEDWAIGFGDGQEILAEELFKERTLNLQETIKDEK